MTNLTSTSQLIQDRLGVPLAAFINERRAKGKSWRLIANEIYAKTDVEVAGETLRLWSLAGIGAA